MKNWVTDLGVLGGVPVDPDVVWVSTTGHVVAAVFCR